MAIFSCLKALTYENRTIMKRKRKQREIVFFDKTKVTIVKVIEKFLCQF